MRRVGISLAIASLVLALLPAPAAAQFGEIGVSAETRVAAEGFGQGIPTDFGDFWIEQDTPTSGAAESSYNWPPPSTFPIPGGELACPVTGCASWHARAFAKAEPTGRLAAYASASIETGGFEADNAGYNQTAARANLADTITLSAPATVRLEGRITGSIVAHHSHIDWYGDPDAGLAVSALFRIPAPGTEGGWETLGGLQEGFEPPVIGCPYPNTCLFGPGVPLPQPRSLNETFSIEVDLPAGTTAFNAFMLADIEILVWGTKNDPHRATHHGSATLNSANSFTFQIVVPDGVVATSGSGLLPIIGGASADDTTAPTIACDAPDGLWHATDVSISCTASDDGSGLADAADSSFTLVTNVPAGTETADAQTNSRQVCDDAGNCATAGPVGGNKVDKRAPAITFGTATPAANANGWHRTDVSIPFTATDGGSGLAATSPAGAVLVLSAEGTSVGGVVTATDAVGNGAAATSPAVNIDKTAPAVTYTGNAGTYTADQSIDIRCAATDALSGVDSDTCADAAGPAYAFTLGANTLSATALDRAGNTGTGSTSFTVSVTFDSLGALVDRLVENAGVEQSLVAKLETAKASAQRGNAAAKNGQLDAFVEHVRALTGSQISAADAAILERLAEALR